MVGKKLALDEIFSISEVCRISHIFSSGHHLIFINEIQLLSTISREIFPLQNRWWLIKIFKIIFKACVTIRKTYIVIDKWIISRFLRYVLQLRFTQSKICNHCCTLMNWFFDICRRHSLTLFISITVIRWYLSFELLLLAFDPKLTVCPNWLLLAVVSGTWLISTKSSPPNYRCTNFINFY